MNLLVTGASGFIGRNFLLGCPRGYEVFAVYNTSKDFLDFLKANNLKNVHAFKCDLSSEKQVKELKGKIGGRVDVCMYLAGSTDLAASIRDPKTDFDNNIIALLNLLTNFCCKRLVYTSSNSVYEGLKGEVTVDSPVNPSYPYPKSKLAAEKHIRLFWSKGAVGEYVIIRLFGVYGPYDKRSKLFSRLVTELCHNRSKTFKVTGDGNNLIDAMYITDVVGGLKAAMNGKTHNLVVNMSSGNPITVNNLVKIAAKTFGIGDIRITHAGTPLQYNLYYGKLDDWGGLEFRPSVGIVEGLKRLAESMSDDDKEDI